MEVWWNLEFKEQVLSKYKIKSFDASDIKKAMKMVVYEPYHKPSQPKKRNVIGCQSIHAVRAAINWKYDDEVYLSSALKDCQILEWIIKARPATKANGVENYKFTANSLKELPACIHHMGEYSYEDMMERAHARGESIAGAGSEWNIHTKVSSEFIDFGDDFKVTLIGRGDFNSDGVPDLLIHVQATNFGGYHLLSKKKDSPVFRVLSPEFTGMNYCLPTWERTPSACLAPAVAKVRDEIGQLYKRKQYNEVTSIANGYIQSCKGNISDVPLAWLLNDLAVAQLRSGKPESCLESLRQIDKLYIYPGGEVLEKAKTTNFELCTSAIGK